MCAKNARNIKLSYELDVQCGKQNNRLCLGGTAYVG